MLICTVDYFFQQLMFVCKKLASVCMTAAELQRIALDTEYSKSEYTFVLKVKFFLFLNITL
jgi:hypothetical protein